MRKRDQILVGVAFGSSVGLLSWTLTLRSQLKELETYLETREPVQIQVYECDCAPTDRVVPTEREL